MSHLHTCTQTSSGIDCTGCKLSQICTEQESSHSVVSTESGDDYSISEELSGSGKGSFSILYLVIAAAATLACVILFTYLLRR